MDMDNHRAEKKNTNSAMETRIFPLFQGNCNTLHIIDSKQIAQWLNASLLQQELNLLWPTPSCGIGKCP